MVMPRIADLTVGEWHEHARFPGILMKSLLTSTDNPFACVNAVLVPPAGVIGTHRHANELETVWIIQGKAILTLEQTDIQLHDGQIIAIPIGLEHALRNEGNTPVKLLIFFTPPLL